MSKTKAVFIGGLTLVTIGITSAIILHEPLLDDLAYASRPVLMRTELLGTIYRLQISIRDGNEEVFDHLFLPDYEDEENGSRVDRKVLKASLKRAKLVRVSRDKSQDKQKIVSDGSYYTEKLNSLRA
jgi:hypothetical protein